MAAGGCCFDHRVAAGVDTAHDSGDVRQSATLDIARVAGSQSADGLGDWLSAVRGCPGAGICASLDVAVIASGTMGLVDAGGGACGPAGASGCVGRICAVADLWFSDHGAGGTAGGSYE